MFRPWLLDPQPDFAWRNFNDVQTGPRVNINNFNNIPRDGRGGLNPAPPFNPNPTFDFPQLFNFGTPDIFARPHRNNGRLRDRVTVILPGGTRIMIERDVMHEHLPRTRNYVQTDTFPLPEFLREYNSGLGAMAGFDEQSFRRAFIGGAAFIFRHLEAVSRSQGPFGASDRHRDFDMFARPRYLLANSRNRPAVVREVFWHVFVLCCVLDQDRALGCSEVFARPIGEFLVEFMPRVEAFLPPWMMQLLFVGYGRVFRETRFEMEVLRELWEMMDAPDHAQLRRNIGPQLAVGGMGSNAHRTWTALRQMGLV